MTSTLAIVAWGRSDIGQATVPAGLSNVHTIAAGYAHNLALKRDGAVVGWGQNDYGQANVPAGLANIQWIGAGEHHSVAVIGAIPQPPVDFFLHGSGATANPLTLVLDRSAPTTATEKYKDSPGINFNSGNPWAAVGVWPANAANSSGQLSVRVLTRIGTNGAGAFCGGHRNAAGLRLCFDSTNRASRLSATM